MPGALAYANPGEDAHIQVFYDRVEAVAHSASLPKLLAYVLAHEIAHILQSVPRHSSSGVMKARWGAEDYAEMDGIQLNFTAEDGFLIRRGMRERFARKMAVMGSQQSF